MTQQTGIQQQLFALQDPKFRSFQKRLLPELAEEAVIGVRTPALRQLAKELSGTAEADAFLQALPHRYFEENQLHAFLLERIRDFSEAAAQTDAFLPFIDNWATCDQLCPKVFRKHLPELTGFIRRWLVSPQPFAVRFGMGCLMRYYLDDAFEPQYPDWVVAAQREPYYVRMMTAWYFATALSKQYDAVLPVLLERRLSPWTHNQTIQKATESFRIPPERKAYLKTLRIKKQEGDLETWKHWKSSETESTSCQSGCC